MFHRKSQQEFVIKVSRSVQSSEQALIPNHTMKSLSECKKYLLLFITGLGCIALAIVLFKIDPVKMVIKKNMKFAPNSDFFRLWQKPPIIGFVSVYIFNITNPEAFLQGKEKLKVQEVGPYVYEEKLENLNVTWNENGTLSYYPRRLVNFRPDLSVGDPKKQNVTIPNVPLLGVFSALHDAGFLINYPFVTLTSFLDAKPILNLSVYDYFWGYDDPLVKLGGSVVPHYINFKKFGILDRIYDEGKNLMNMNVTENSDTIEETGRFLSIESMNGNRGLSQWGYVEEKGKTTRPENTKCNTLRGVTEGILFPPFIDRRAKFRMFRKVFCRPLPITFVAEVEKFGIPAYLYNLADNFADPPSQNPENECYCRKTECLKKGLMDLSPCVYNIPTAASLPHFFNADPSIAEKIDGLNPDAEKHKPVVILQPDIGIPLYARSKVQTNLIIRKTYYDPKITPFNDLVVPLFWIDVAMDELPPDVIQLLRLGVVIAPEVQTGLFAILGLSGVICAFWSLKRTYEIVYQEQKIHRHRNPNSNLPFDYNVNNSKVWNMPNIKNIPLEIVSKKHSISTIDLVS